MNLNLKICNKIGDILINEKINDLGLMIGNAGIAIFLYNLEKKHLIINICNMQIC